MNLTEKILKGITEAEFEINPELQKKQAYTRAEMAEAFIARGWMTADSFSDVDDSSTYIFTHTEFPGVKVRMKAKNDTKLVFKRMVLFMPHDKNGSLTPATPSNVAVVTDMLKEMAKDQHTKLGVDDEKSTDRQRGVTDQELHDAFIDNGWSGYNVGQSGSLVSYEFTHPKIYGTSFHTTYDVSSGMTKPNMYLRYEGKPGQNWFAATPAAVSKITKQLIGGGSKAKFAGDSSILREELNAVGWVIAASSGIGDVVYEHPGVEKKIEVQDDADGKITKVVLVHGDGSGTDMLIDVESIVKMAQKWAAAGGQS